VNQLLIVGILAALVVSAACDRVAHRVLDLHRPAAALLLVRASPCLCY
jgi:hypothetical protein